MTGEPPREEVHPFEKEREEKDDGRYLIFYTFEDDETGKVRADGEGGNG
jgi:hypothetical protein